MYTKKAQKVEALLISDICSSTQRWAKKGKIGKLQRELEKEISFLILQVQNPARSLLDSTIKSVFWTKVTEGPKN